MPNIYAHYLQITCLTFSVFLPSCIPTTVVKTDGELLEATAEVNSIQQKIDELFSAEQVEETEWQPDEMRKHYKDNETVLKEFDEFYKRGILAKGTSFLIHDPSHREESVKLVNLLFFTKDFDSLYKVAKWLKGVANREEFTYALAATLLHRQDLHANLPPWHNVFPNYFVTISAMNELREAKQKGMKNFTVEMDVEDTNDGLSYWRHDPGLNSLHYNWFLSWPQWMNPTKYGGPYWVRKGELYLYYHQQLLARFNLEKAANNHSEASFNLQGSTEVYDPDLRNAVGERMADRSELGRVDPTSTSFEKTNSNMGTVILGGGFFTVDNKTMISFRELGLYGAAFLGDALFNTTASINKPFYGSLYDTVTTVVASYGITNQTTGLGALSTELTALRDPAFYSLLDFLLTYLRGYKMFYIPPYTSDHLGFPGVTIEEVETDDWTTYFEYFEFDVSEELSGGEREYSLVARQKRLNHDPFKVRYSVTNHGNLTVGGMVKAFLGPSVDFRRSLPQKLDQERSKFVEIDRFPVILESGHNTFERDSSDSTTFVSDKERSVKSVTYTKGLVECGLPDNLMLPKGGDGEGTEFTLFVILVPYFHPEGVPGVPFRKEPNNFVLCGSRKFEDFFPMGFPFDRQVSSIDPWNVTNLYTRQVKIRHKE